MYRVLIGVDPEITEPSRIAEAVASLPESERNVEATLLNVFKEFEVTGAESGTVDSDEMFDDESFPEAVGVIRDGLHAEGIETTAVRRHGDIAEELLAEAADRDVDLIVIGGRKRSPVGKALFGSVTQAVLLDADRPVMVVRTA